MSAHFLEVFTCLYSLFPWKITIFIWITSAWESFRMKLSEHLGASQLLRVNSVVTLCYQSCVRAFDWLWLMLQNLREALLLMCWLTWNYSSERITIAENPSSWLLLLQNAMEMSSQLDIILTPVGSQVPHWSLLRHRSAFVWQSIRNCDCCL